jgi:hypothetical protein
MKGKAVNARPVAGKFGLAAVLAAALLAPLANVPASAQQGSPQGAPATTTQKKSWNFKNASIQGALKALFQSMNLNYIIDQDVQGTVNVSLNDISFDVALRAILRSTNPPLTYDIENGIYHVKVKKSVEAATPTAGPTGPEGKTDVQYNIYHLGINWYDVTEMVRLLGTSKGITIVPVNSVSGSSGGGTGGAGGGGGGGAPGAGGGGPPR